MKKNDFQSRMEQSLVDFKENHQFLPSVSPKKRWHYFEFSDNIFPPIKHSLLQHIYDSAIPLHDFSNHVRSSQAFCFNILYPLILNEKNILLDFFSKMLGINVREIVVFAFEYQPENDNLGEWKGSEKPEEYVTSSDLFLSLRTNDNKTVNILFEIKFTEDSFSKCNGYTSNGNETRSYCEDWPSIFGNPTKCYLQRPAKGRSARTYFDKFVPLQNSFPNHESKTCPFIENHQCLRLLAFAKSLDGQDVVNYFALVYHDDNAEILRAWDSFKALLSTDLSKRLLTIPASHLVKVSQDINFKAYMKTRYQIK